MTSFFINWLVAAVALLVTAFVMPGIRVRGFGIALFSAVVIGFLNVLVKPMILFLTLPLNILSLGLFTFVVNAIVLRLAAALTPGFEISSWISAIIGSALYSFLISTIFWLLESRFLG